MTGPGTIRSHQPAAALTSRIIGSSGRPSNQQRGPRAQPHWHPSRGPASLARSPRRSPPPVCRPDHGPASGENDLGPGGSLVELAHGQHLLHFGAKILRSEMEHLHGGLAGEDVSPGFMDHP